MVALDRLTAALLLVSTVLLALLELFFLPLWFGDVMVPISLVVAAVSMPLLVRAAVRTTASVGFGGLVLFVWFLVLFVVGLLGPGGDMVFVPDWRSLALVAAGLIPGAIALGSAMGSTGRREGATGGKEAD